MSAEAPVPYYPALLDLRGRRCVVVGGGTIAEGKVAALLEAGARVTVVAPELGDPLLRAFRDGRLAWRRRAYRAGDLAGALLAIAATDDRDVNERVWREAGARNVLVNAVDDPPRCSFILPSIMRRGDLTIAVCTGGKAPALAVRLRQWLERVIGDEHARFLSLAGRIRAPLAARYPGFEERKRRWYQLVDSDVLDLLRAGDEDAARRRFAEILGVDPGQGDAADAPEPAALPARGVA